MGKKLKVLVSIFLFCLLSQGVWALVFTAKDDAFTIDLPSSWEKVESQDYLSLKNTSGATMRFVMISDCFDRKCLDKIIDKEIKDLTKRNFQIIKNEYTGDIIRETEFSTGDPLLSFDFTKQDMFFTAGYFLSGGKAYNVGIRGVPDTEAYYLLSFISPLPKQEQTEEVLQENSLEDNQSAKLETIEQNDLLEVQTAPKTEEKPKIQVAKQQNKKIPLHKVKDNPKLKFLQKILRIAFCILLGYVLLFVIAFIYRIFSKNKEMVQNTNPNSPYPLQGKRLYGSPDLFWRLHDNKGNHYIATCTRWGGLFAFGGLMAGIFFSLIRLVCAIIALQKLHPSLLINTLYSISYLFSACGFVFFIFGIILNILFPYKYQLYDDKGKLLFKCIQKGLSLSSEKYFVTTKEGHVICKFIRKNFTPLRTWKIFDIDKEIAEIKEKSISKALLRLIFGHMLGIFRSDYAIKAQMDSSGDIKSASKLAAQFNLSLDKPQAVSSDIMLVFSAVLFLRDRDKIFPWIN